LAELGRGAWSEAGEGIGGGSAIGKEVLWWRHSKRGVA